MDEEFNEISHMLRQITKEDELRRSIITQSFLPTNLSNVTALSERKQYRINVIIHNIAPYVFNLLVRRNYYVNSLST